VAPDILMDHSAFTFWVKQSVHKQELLDPEAENTVTVKISRPVHPTAHHHIPEDLNLWLLLSTDSQLHPGDRSKIINFSLQEYI